MIKKLFLAIVVMLVAAQRGECQLASPIAWHPANRGSVLASGARGFQSASEGMPGWLKWGIVGAIAGGTSFALAGNIDTGRNHSVVGDFAYGAATGFVLVAGGIRLYDWVCGGDTRSRRAGLCGR